MVYGGKSGEREYLGELLSFMGEFVSFEILTKDMDPEVALVLLIDWAKSQKTEGVEEFEIEMWQVIEHQTFLLSRVRRYTNSFTCGGDECDRVDVIVE